MQADEHTASAAKWARQVVPGQPDALAKHSNRNDRAASAKDRDERNSPQGIAEQCRSDPHTHSHDNHDCGRARHSTGASPFDYPPLKIFGPESFRR